MTARASVGGGKSCQITTLRTESKPDRFSAFTDDERDLIYEGLVETMPASRPVRALCETLLDELAGRRP